MVGGGAGVRWSTLQLNAVHQLALRSLKVSLAPFAGYQEAAVQAVGGLTGGSGSGSNGAAAAAALPAAERARIEEAIEAAFTTGSGG